MGIVQESLHSIKTENQQALVLKLDLVKAFDRVNWSFLRLVLLQIGVPGNFVSWILGCVESANFVVLINGTPSAFFPMSRDIRHGCPLSPLLFILVIEGLSLLISQAHSAGDIYGIKLAPQLYLTHLLFVDDAILFDAGTLSDWQHYKHILDTFCKVTSMEINLENSSFLFHNIDEVTNQQI